MTMDGYYADFYGWDVVSYYIFAFRTFVQQYSWQVRLSFAIIFFCVLTMMVVFMLFIIRIKQRNKHQRNFDHCYNTYSEAFYEILEEETPLSERQILEICDEEEHGFEYYDGFLYAEILTHIRMSMNDVLYLPNLQRLCEVTGAKAAIENRLKKRKSIMRSLQMVNTLPLKINEGLLAIYTSHSKHRVSQLARAAYCMCSQSEPYLYLLEDMNKPQSPWYRITMHRILGWNRAQNLPMPPLWMMATQCENSQMAAFLVEEISYWGTDEEKHQLRNFFDDPRIQCRIAAIRSLARLGYEDAEEQIIASYESQPQSVRREMLKALCSFHSGKYTEFFAEVYKNTPSHTTRKIALECLYDYSEEGRLRFETLDKETGDQDAIFFAQIRTLAQLHATC